MKIVLTSVIVNDPIEAHRFYTGVLGFQTQQFIPEARLAIVVSPEQPDGTAVMLEPNDNPVSKTFQRAVYEMGLPVIIFGVDDIQQETARLKKLGVVFRQDPVKQDWGGYLATFEDTCGNLISLAQQVA